MPVKRPAIHIDGTWNTLNNNTNVWRLKSLCDPGGAKPNGVLQPGGRHLHPWKVRGGIGSNGLDNEIVYAHTWLVQAYEAGDETFVFGFSRGTYAARSLSGPMSKCGVLGPGAPLSIEQLYVRYRRRAEPHAPRH